MDTLMSMIITAIKVFVTSAALLLTLFLQNIPLYVKAIESTVLNNYQTVQDTPQQFANQTKIAGYKVEHIIEGLKALPDTRNHRTGTNVKSAANVSVESGDTSVSTAKVQLASKIINQTSLPTLKNVIGLTPASNIDIVLFSSAKTYGNALLKAGVDRNSIQAMITDTGGVTVGTTIWIPLYNLEDQSDLANVLSHELFHACAASQGFGDRLPIWINEGTAWRIGLMAQQKVNPQKASAEMAYYENDVKKAVRNGSVLSLYATEQDILKAHYNVEYEDFMAVEELTKTYGTAAYQTFIENLKHQNVDSDFQTVFHSSRKDFENSFLESLRKNN